MEPKLSKTNGRREDVVIFQLTKRTSQATFMMRFKLVKLGDMVFVFDEYNHWLGAV